MIQIDHCFHSQYTGMRRSEPMGDVIPFACDRCGATYSAVRCSGTSKSGERCRNVARRGATACRRHGAGEAR